MDIGTLSFFDLQIKKEFAHFYTHSERNIIMVEFQHYSTIDLEEAKVVVKKAYDIIMKPIRVNV